jgi:hypothetical protein
MSPEDLELMTRALSNQVEKKKSIYRKLGERQ